VADKFNKYLIVKKNNEVLRLDVVSHWFKDMINTMLMLQAMNTRNTTCVQGDNDDLSPMKYMWLCYRQLI
jgi:hypothetical protein